MKEQAKLAAIPAPIAAQTEKCGIACSPCGVFCSLDKGHTGIKHRWKGDGHEWTGTSCATEQVDAARCPKCGSGKVSLAYSKERGVLQQYAGCSNMPCDFQPVAIHSISDFAQFFCAASLKLETQPPSEVSALQLAKEMVKDWESLSKASKDYWLGLATRSLEALSRIKSAASSSPLETPAAAPENARKFYHDWLEGECSVCGETAETVTSPYCNHPSATPAPADTGATNWHKPGCPRFSGVGECDCR